MAVGIFTPDLGVIPGQLLLHPAVGSPSNREDFSEAQTTTIIPSHQNDIFSFPPPAPLEPVPNFFTDAMLFPDHLPIGSALGGPPSDQPDPPSQAGPENPPSANSPVTEEQSPAKESGKAVRRSARRVTQRAHPDKLQQSSPSAEELMPRTRGRKRKQEPGDLGHAGDGNDVQRTQRSRKYLERNRIAATKCRERKRDQAIQLEAKCQYSEYFREGLLAERDMLRTEVCDLKMKVLQHARCGSPLIEDYIESAARDTVNAAVASRRASQDDTVSSPNAGEHIRDRGHSQSANVQAQGPPPLPLVSPPAMTNIPSQGPRPSPLPLASAARSNPLRQRAGPSPLPLASPATSNPPSGMFGQAFNGYHQGMNTNMAAFDSPAMMPMMPMMTPNPHFEGGSNAMYGFPGPEPQNQQWGPACHSWESY